MGAAILDAVYGTPVPLQISGLILWLKADAGTFQNTALTTLATADADPVGGWQDQSGQRNHVTQSTSTKRPTLKLAIQNGLPVMRFDGVDDFLSNTMVQAQPMTALVVGKMVANNRYFFDGNVTRIAIAMGLAVAGNLGMFAGSTQEAAHTQGAFHSYSAVFSGASSVLYVDGAAFKAGNPGANTLNSISVGAPTGGAGNVLNGDIGEMMFYAGVLSVDKLSALGTYVRSRWGTP